MIRQQLQDYFSEIDSKSEMVEEFSIGEKIGLILNVKQEKIQNQEEFADFLAFQFVPNYKNQETGWKTYFGPKIVWRNDNNEFIEFPSIQQVNQDMLLYWRNRVKNFNNPILIYRYANLVFDFEPVILNKNIDYELAQEIIDRGVDVCLNNLSDGLGCKFKLERCLKLALQINDNERLNKLKKVIFETEIKYAQDDKPGLWGYSFQWLVLDHGKNINLNEEEKSNIITNIENRLLRLSSVDNPDPWHIECAVKLLASYYSINKDEENLKRVLLNLENAFRHNEYSNSDGMLIGSYLEQLKGIYSDHASFEFAKQARDKIINELGNLGNCVKFNTHQISVETEIKQKDIDNFIVSIFGDSDSTPLNIVLGKIAVNFILRKGMVDEQLKDLSKNHPFSYLAGRVVNSEDGYPMAKFGSIEDDYDKHLLENFSRNLHFHAVFLRMIFDKLRKVYTPEIIIENILLSPVFRGDDRDYILKLLKHFWNQEYLAVSCISVPLIEDAVRNLSRMNGITYIKFNGQGGYDVLELDRLLRSGLIKETFQKLGEDTEYYFRALLTERIGWNLRNNIAHGINKKFFDNEDVANRLVHVLLCLALIRKNEEVSE